MQYSNDPQGDNAPPSYPGADYYANLAKNSTPPDAPRVSKYSEAPYLSPVMPLPRSQQMRSHNAFTRFVVAWGGMNRLLISLGSAALSVVVYYYIWDPSWLFAFGLVGLLLIHELGHDFALRVKRLPATFPIFIPGMGAFVTLPNQPISMRDDAEISLAGPLFGGIGSLLCLIASFIFIQHYAFNFVGPEPTLLRLATFSFFINLLNLIPILPLDGGHIGRVLSPILGVIGLGLLVLLYFVPGSPLQGSIFLLLIGFLGINEVMRGFNSPVRQVIMRSADRISVAVMYGGLAILLFLGYWATTNDVALTILRWRIGIFH